MGIQATIRFITKDDVNKIAFRCPKSLGMYEWVVMPFGLKNAGATYQKLMNFIFHNMIIQFVEVYINDIVVKSAAILDHLGHLIIAFKQIRKHKLKMHPLKSAFR